MQHLTTIVLFMLCSHLRLLRRHASIILCAVCFVFRKASRNKDLEAHTRFGNVKKVEKMFQPDAQAIEHAISAEELARILAAHSSRINAEISEFQLSPQTIYCSKTGQPIGELRTETLYQALEIQGRDELQAALYENSFSSVHPAWRKTGSAERYNDTLDRLCEKQPHAYAVYSLGFMTQQYFKLTGSKQFINRETHAEFHWSLARAWQILSLLPAAQVAELNDALCHLLVYAPASLRSLYSILGQRSKSADTIARLAIGGELAKTIDKATENYLSGLSKTKNATDKTDFIQHAQKLRRNYQSTNTHTTRQTAFYETAVETIKYNYATVDDAARGPTQFRKQRLAKKRQLERELNIQLSKRKQQALELENEFGALLAGGQLLAPIQPQHPVSVRWSTIENELDGLPGMEEEGTISPEFLAALDMDTIALPGETAFGNSDGPESRTITWAELAKRQDEKDQEEKARLQRRLDAMPVTSFAARLARMENATEEKPVETKAAEIPAFFKRFQK